jgi:hypothetical protein
MTEIIIGIHLKNVGIFNQRFDKLLRSGLFYIYKLYRGEKMTNKKRVRIVKDFAKKLEESRNNLKDNQVVRVVWTNAKDQKEATLFDRVLSFNLDHDDEYAEIEIITRYGRGDFYFGSDDWNWENILDPKIEVFETDHTKFNIDCPVCQEISFGYVNDDGKFICSYNTFYGEYELYPCSEFSMWSSEHNDDRIRVIL